MIFALSQGESGPQGPSGPRGSRGITVSTFSFKLILNNWKLIIFLMTFVSVFAVMLPGIYW